MSKATSFEVIMETYKTDERKKIVESNWQVIISSWMARTALTSLLVKTNSVSNFNAEKLQKY